MGEKMTDLGDLEKFVEEETGKTLDELLEHMSNPVEYLKELLTAKTKQHKLSILLRMERFGRKPGNSIPAPRHAEHTERTSLQEWAKVKAHVSTGLAKDDTSEEKHIYLSGVLRGMQPFIPQSAISQIAFDFGQIVAAHQTAMKGNA